MEIILTNKTNYSSRDLKKLFRLVAIDYKKKHFDFRFDSVRVRCIYRRIKDGFCGGYAYYNNNVVVMKLQKHPRSYGKKTFEQEIANTFHHELDHCRGRKHGEMISDHLRVTPIDEHFRVTQRAEKKRPGKKSPLEMVEHIGKLLSQWQTKKRRADNAIRRLNKRQKYFLKKHESLLSSEHRMAAISK